MSSVKMHRLRAAPWGTRSEAATILRCHVDHIDRLIRDKKIRAIKLGRNVRIDLQQLFKMAQAGK
jgi:excisionase family DNA binding protein